MRNELTDPEIIAFINDVAGRKPFNFCFCGGEPLLRLEIVSKAAAILAKAGVFVSLVTNGSLLTAEGVSKLAESGVSRVQVSLDGACAKTHEILRQFNGAFDLALAAIKRCTSARLFREVSVAFTPTSFNCEELGDVAKLCIENGVSLLRVQPLMAIGRAVQYARLFPSAQQYRNLVQTINSLRHTTSELRFEWGDPVDHLIRYSTSRDTCLNYITVGASGDILPSPYLPIAVGNIRQHSFGEYWDSGLSTIWANPVVAKAARKIHSVHDMGKKSYKNTQPWVDKNVDIDIMKRNRSR
jgi:Predicted Fe-S oxidoreductases